MRAHMSKLRAGWRATTGREGKQQRGKLLEESTCNCVIRMALAAEQLSSARWALSVQQPFSLPGVCFGTVIDCSVLERR